MLEIISAKSGLAKKYKIKKGDKILGFDGYEAEDVLDYLFYDSKPTFTMRVLSADGEREIKVDKPEDESFDLTFKAEEKIRACMLRTTTIR